MSALQICITANKTHGCATAGNTEIYPRLEARSDPSTLPLFPPHYQQARLARCLIAFLKQSPTTRTSTAPEKPMYVIKHAYTLTTVVNVSIRGIAGDKFDMFRRYASSS